MRTRHFEAGCLLTQKGEFRRSDSSLSSQIQMSGIRQQVNNYFHKTTQMFIKNYNKITARISKGHDSISTKRSCNWSLQQKIKILFIE